MQVLTLFSLFLCVGGCDGPYQQEASPHSFQLPWMVCGFDSRMLGCGPWSSTQFCGDSSSTPQGWSCSNELCLSSFICCLTLCSFTLCFCSANSMFLSYSAFMITRSYIFLFYIIFLLFRLHHKAILTHQTTNWQNLNPWKGCCVMDKWIPSICLDPHGRSMHGPSVSWDLSRECFESHRRASPEVILYIQGWYTRSHARSTEGSAGGGSVEHEGTLETAPWYPYR